jgi:hypothetical protein
MAGSEQRPTDDVLGHGGKRPEDETAAGDDRGKRFPDDVEGHMPKRYGTGGQDTEAVDEDQVADDTQGHGRYFQDAEAVDEDQGDDVEGHRRRFHGG